MPLSAFLGVQYRNPTTGIRASNEKHIQPQTRNLRRVTTDAAMGSVVATNLLDQRVDVATNPPKLLESLAGVEKEYDGASRQLSSTESSSPPGMDADRPSGGRRIPLDEKMERLFLNNW